MDRILHDYDAVLLDARKLVRVNAITVFKAQPAPIPYAFSARRVYGI
jgi:hypothetical protein